jgi:hypothetical protein
MRHLAKVVPKGAQVRILSVSFLPYMRHKVHKVVKLG